jgi:hypothetical protein
MGMVPGFSAERDAAFRSAIRGDATLRCRRAVHAGNRLVMQQIGVR